MKVIVTKNSGKQEEIDCATWEYDGRASRKAAIFYKDEERKQPIAYLTQIKKVEEPKIYG
jgi:hypothetical protein